MSEHKMLIVAFDGADLELLREFDCTNILQKERGGKRGRIDNSSGIPLRSTPQLFTSFLTGLLPSEHGVDSMETYNSDLIHKVENRLDRYTVFRKFKGVREAIYALLGSPRRPYTRGDIEGTPFTDLTESYIIDVPVVDFAKSQTNIMEMLACDGNSLENVKEEVERQQDKEFRLTLSALEDDFDLVFAHFHVLDYYQHLTDETKTDVLRQKYREVDELAAALLEKADEEEVSHVLFMSDHGRPEGRHHNEQAFFSADWDVRVNKPHITDFRPVILEILPSGSPKTRQVSGGERSEEETMKRLEELGYL